MTDEFKMADWKPETRDEIVAVALMALKQQHESTGELLLALISHTLSGRSDPGTHIPILNKLVADGRAAQMFWDQHQLLLQEFTSRNCSCPNCKNPPTPPAQKHKIRKDHFPI